MIMGLRRGSFLNDCLLAAFSLAVASFLTALLGGALSWRGEFGIMLVPTLFLCRYARCRAASICAIVSLLAGAWIVVPPRWSFRIDTFGVFAIVIFGATAALAIALAALSQRKHARAVYQV